MVSSELDFILKNDDDKLAQFFSLLATLILIRNSSQCTGNFFIDDEVLAAEGVTNFDQYAVTPGDELLPDLFV